MTKRWQYQGLFQPVSVLPETTTLDMWYRQPSEPIFSERRTADFPHLFFTELDFPPAGGDIRRQIIAAYMRGNV